MSCDSVKFKDVAGCSLIWFARHLPKLVTAVALADDTVSTTGAASEPWRMARRFWLG